MKPSLLLLAALGGAALAGGMLQQPAPAQAAAPIYPWCMQPSGRWGPDCYYATIEQCRAAASAVGFCYQNPAFTPNPVPAPGRRAR
ncbi:DUF3551 domain-containing protein [Bradyrhizobium sp. LHD-71]|uniref:DUF3551 domain-containing protein n=1 Tax=Bradyrhizobium sp. LHD-71 TaxID=3072141 RepID=UPI0035BE99BA